jgi:cyclase
VEIYQISPGVMALVRGPDQGSNAGLVRTGAGVAAVDSTSDVKSMQEFLRAARVQRQEVRLVVNTHFHGDHVGGNALFDCPILAHRLCRERIAQRRSAQAQRILPTEVFEERRDLEMGGVQLEVIHFGGHTPDSTVVWLPETGVLFTGDLIFAGRYPYLGDANVPDLIVALKRLGELGAQTIVPGHGPLCDEAEVAAQIDYLATSWARTAEHLAQGHSLKETTADRGYPGRGKGATHRRKANIEVMYEQLVRIDAERSG